MSYAPERETTEGRVFTVTGGDWGDVVGAHDPIHDERIVVNMGPQHPSTHGVLRPTIIHPEAFTFKLPDTVSLEEGAMVEPLEVGMQAATKAKIKPGDIAVVIGAGPIGMVTALAALAVAVGESALAPLIA